MPKFGYIHTQRPAGISAGVEPVKNVLNTLFLIANCRDYPGIHPFITRVYEGLDHQRRRINETITVGLCYAPMTEAGYPDFPAFLEEVAQTDAQVFVDRVFESYDRISAYKVGIISDPEEVTTTPRDQERLLSSKAVYLEYLTACFGHETLDYEIEGRAYDLMVDSERLKSVMLEHLRYMWETYIREEFERYKPVLFKAAAEYNQMPLNSLDPLAAVRKITGHDLETEWADKQWEIDWIARSDRIVFVPSAHMGPYLGRKLMKNAVYIYFSPRIVEGFSPSSPELTRADIGMRLTTLGDEVRLQILKMLTEVPELSSKEIMTALNLTQSSASRHLKQLSVNGYVNERRQHSAKVYRLNDSVVKQTLEAVFAFLNIKPS